MKAVWIVRDRDPWGHSVARLIKGLSEGEREAFEDLLDAALYLDKLYIPTRYPDALADLIPAEAFTREEAAKAHEHAAALLGRVGEWMEQQWS